MNRIGRRDFLRAVGAAAAVAASSRSLDAQAARRPNVILIYTDDQPLSQLGCYGGRVLSPHMDSLAADGMRFTRFYVSSAVCSPSRYSTLSGRYASRSKRLHTKFPPGGPVNMGWQPGVYGEKHTLPHVLRQHGYVTGMVGKWHQGTGGGIKKVLGDADPKDPDVAAKLKRNYELTIKSIKECGFDYAAGVYLANVSGGKKWFWLPHALGWHNQEWVTQGALDFIDQNKDKPFFLYMPTTLVHGPSPVKAMAQDPRIVPTGYLDRPPTCQPPREDVFERVRKAGVGKRFAGVTWLDDAVGAVLKKLDRLGIAEDTVVLFASDNGTRGKFTCYDAGARMACMARWPGKIKSGTVCEELVSNVDFAPTIFDICGITPPAEMKTDGKSFLPLLTGQGPYERKSLYLEVTTERAVVSHDHFKYIAVRYPPDIQKCVDGGEKYSHWCLKCDEHLHHTYNAEKLYPAYFDQDQLYDLRKDPNEQRNLAGDAAYAEKLAEMKHRLEEYCRDLPHTYGEFKTG